MAYKKKEINDLNLELYFDPDVDSESEIVEKVKSAYKANVLFFGNTLGNRIEVHILYEREEMDRVLNMKTEPWVVGATPKGAICIFSPKIFDKVSSHPVSNFGPVLTHEMAHIFTNKLFKFYQPKWLHEGLAGHVAEQYKNKQPKKLSDFEKLHNREDWNSAPGYANATCLTTFLIEKFGKDQFLKFLKNLSEDEDAQKTFATFTKLFEDNFTTDFQKILQKWQKKVLSQQKILGQH